MPSSNMPHSVWSFLPMCNARPFLASMAVISLTGAISLVDAHPLTAQTLGNPGISVGLAGGNFEDYPSQFSSPFCEGDGRGITGKVGYWATPFFALEASTTVSGARGEKRCFFPGIPAPNDGMLFSRSVFDEDIQGRSFVATNIAAVFEPLPDQALSPRVQAGVGRVWDKDLGNWFYGGGFRFRLGSYAIVADVERWNLSFDMRRELLIFRDNGAHELQSFEIIPQSPRPYLLRIGLERRIR